MQDLEENHEFKPENIVKKILSLVLAAICIGASVVMFLWITIPSSPIAPHDIEN
jgi:ABC-type enterochelin transport system permease subunit|tara:strand:+ start:401 stop:562 length:162 start_codon:yes stop_codon:yes gene_type:complete